MKIRNLKAAILAAAIMLAPSIVFAQASLLPPGEQCFFANAGINGMVGLLGTITPGSGYTNGTYPNQALTGGSGSSATANITVAGGAVTAVTIVNPGTQYVVGDTFSATFGGGSGFSIPIASTTINSSLAGGSVGYYVPNTLTFKNTWQDTGQTILNTNPVNLDQNGCAVVYGQGAYRQILKDNLGNTIWDQNTSDYSSGTSPFWAGLAGGTPNVITITDPNFNSTDGQSISFKILSNNTGSSTLNVSGIGAVPILKETTAGPVALEGGELIAGNIIVVTYDSLLSSFQIIQGAQEPPPPAAPTIAYGQAQFVLSTSTSVKLLPFKGNMVTFPSGAIATIASGGIQSLFNNAFLNGTAGQTLSNTTLYYAYLWDSTGGGSYVIDWSTTGHSADTTTGIEIKNGDPTRVLVGVAYLVAGNFLDANANRLVGSWFNRRNKTGSGSFSTNRTTTSGSIVEINSEIRTNFVCWGDNVLAAYAGSVQTSGAGNNSTNAIVLDSTATVLAAIIASNPTGSQPMNAALSVNTSPAEGFHFLSIGGFVSGGTGTWFSANSNLSFAVTN